MPGRHEKPRVAPKDHAHRVRSLDPGHRPAHRLDGVAGVTQVVNRMTALPVSQFDDELRFRIARSIYGNANFWNYSIMANPPIHIVVDRGQVTLTGVVQSNVDRMLALSLATGFGAFSVTSELKTDAEMKALLDRRGH